MLKFNFFELSYFWNCCFLSPLFPSKRFSGFGLLSPAPDSLVWTSTSILSSFNFYSDWYFKCEGLSSSSGAIGISKLSIWTSLLIDYCLLSAYSSTSWCWYCGFLYVLHMYINTIVSAAITPKRKTIIMFNRLLLFEWWVWDSNGWVWGACSYTQSQTKWF